VISSFLLETSGILICHMRVHVRLRQSLTLCSTNRTSYTGGSC